MPFTEYLCAKDSTCFNRCALDPAFRMGRDDQNPL